MGGGGACMYNPYIVTLSHAHARILTCMHQEGLLLLLLLIGVLPASRLLGSLLISLLVHSHRYVAISGWHLLSYIPHQSTKPTDGSLISWTSPQIYT